MNKKEILALSAEELRIKALLLRGWHSTSDESAWSPVDGDPPHMYFDETPDYPRDIYAAWFLFESVYGHGGKIKDGAWVLGTVHNGRDCAHACLMWKDKSYTKFRPLKVEVDLPRGEMARAITLAWTCAMLGVSDV